MSEPMICKANGKGAVCPCSLVTATGGECGVFGPPPTMREAFPYLFADETTETPAYLQARRGSESEGAETDE